MTTDVGARRITASLWACYAQGRPAERACYVIGAVLFASGLFHLGVFAVDGGPWLGPVSWRKAVTFGLAFGLTLITITWVGSFVRLGDKARGRILGAFAAACVVETGLITLQAWRHVPSHFNNETALNTGITRILAFGGLALIVPLALLSVAAFRTAPGVAPSMRLAVRVGFVALDVALATGAAMVAKSMVTLAGGDQQAAYQASAALKPAHAVTMHAILVLPGLAWLMALAGWGSEARRVRVITVLSAGYGLVAAVVVLISVIRAV